MLLLSLSVGFQSVMLFYKLIPDRLDCSINLFNELAASVYLYLMLMLTDFQGENLLRDTIGLSLLALVCLVVTVNAMKAFISSYPSAKKKILLILRKLPRRQNVSSSSKTTVAVRPTFSQPKKTTNFQVDSDQTRSIDRSLNVDRIYSSQS